MDLVVYGRRAPSDSCGLFLDLYPDFDNRRYALREIDSSESGRDNSISRCTIQTDGFLPEKFKLGKPTPGAENDCSGTHFIWEEHLRSTSSDSQRFGSDEPDIERSGFIL